MDTINGRKLTQNERSAYARGSSRAQRAYLKKHGSASIPAAEGDRVNSSGAWEWSSPAAAARNTMALRSSVEAWERTHGASYAAAMYAGGIAGIKAMHKRHGITAVGKDNYKPREDARLLELGLVTAVGTRTRKPAAVVVEVVEVVEAPAPVESVTVADVAAAMPERVTLVTVAAPADVVEPVTVPAPMPEQTRAARKASNRELAAALRAAGLEARGDVWARAQAGEPVASIAADMAAVR